MKQYFPRWTKVMATAMVNKGGTQKRKVTRTGWRWKGEGASGASNYPVILTLLWLYGTFIYLFILKGTKKILWKSLLNLSVYIRNHCCRKSFCTLWRFVAVTDLVKSWQQEARQESQTENGGKKKKGRVRGVVSQTENGWDIQDGIEVKTMGQGQHTD